MSGHCDEEKAYDRPWKGRRSRVASRDSLVSLAARFADRMATAGEEGNYIYDSPSLEVDLFDVCQSTVFATNDQHAYVRLGDGADLQVGNLVDALEAFENLDELDRQRQRG
jgi:hypothetical protein